MTLSIQSLIFTKTINIKGDKEEKKKKKNLKIARTCSQELK